MSVFLARLAVIRLCLREHARVKLSRSEKDKARSDFIPCGGLFL